MPRAQSMCGLLVVSRGKDAKTSLSAPESFYCQFRHSRHYHLHVLLLSDPQTQAVAVLGKPKSQEMVIFHGGCHRPRLRLLSLTQPTELLVTFLGTRPSHASSSIVPPEVRRRTEPGWGQSESLCRLQAGCRLAAGGGITTVHCFHFSATTLQHSCSVVLPLPRGVGAVKGNALPVTSFITAGMFPLLSHLGPGIIRFRLGETC